VDIAQAIKYPGLIYQQFPKREYQDAAHAVIDYLDKYFGQVGGRFAAHEHLPREEGRRPTHGTELCTIVEYMYSLEKLLEIFGDISFADRLEVLTFNALPGACKGDFWAHQYDTQSNQVVVSVAERPWDNSRTANLYGVGPNYPCCIANLHQGWPRYVAHMWMATEDNGLVALAYGPCDVTARVGAGQRIRLIEETEYPFDGEIRIRIESSEPVKCPLYFRIPTWEGSAKISVGNRAENAPGGEFFSVTQEWRRGDTVSLSFPMKLQHEVRHGSALAVRKGPLYFSLRIGHEYKQRTQFHLGAADWEIFPSTPWNIALADPRGNPEGWAKVEKRAVSSLPFAHAGEPVFCAEDGAYTTWDRSEPLVLRMRGKQLDSWSMRGANADDPPSGATESCGPDVSVELVPYGCTRLRISEFPLVETGDDPRTPGLCNRPVDDPPAGCQGG
jgi:hypothetical protein